MTLEVHELRGGCVEGRHPISAVMVDASGRVLERAGPPLVTTWRSAAKPFQLEASLSLLGRDDFDPADLAVGASSHSGQPVHVARVGALGAALGVDVHGLLCGAHRPLHTPSADALVRADAAPTTVHNNCSGKHVFMAGATRAVGADRDYRDPDHPVQRRVREIVDRVTGGAVHAAVIDGCGVPCFVLPVDGMARAWAELAVATRDGPGIRGRIGRAMRDHPLLVSGDGRDDYVAMRAAARPIVAKVGGAGVMCVAVPDEGVGIALKVHSGAGAPRAVALEAVLSRWLPGVLPEGAMASFAELRNWVGRDVGARRAVWG